MKKIAWGALYLLVFLLSFGLGIALTAMSGSEFGGFRKVDWNESVGSIETDIAYGSGPLHKFDLYLPANRDRATKLVVYVHAGGFTGGDKADDANIAKFFASKGYVAATINYSLSGNGSNANVRTMADEVKQGVAFIVQAARSRGYPVDAMAISGGSAGGALAMIYAYREAEHAPVPVKAVISLVGPAAFDPIAWFGIDDDFASDESATSGAAFVSIMTGEPVSAEMMRSGAYRDVLKSITPTALVTPGAPPTLVAFGALDKVAPFAASTGLLQALERQGVPHDALVFPNSGHGLNRDPKMLKVLGTKIDEYLDRYLPLD
ncbi:alpha/beta hydrolase [Comamonas terrigena]|uniref:alpha/beta hydrolase n=1 Tax=Comamonas terrigena TaxID=32013 RepID=UPI00244A4662|nr:alpha/beta hydrolase [Comamonas terrigena]MDH1701910.1 alpha/beta hydrolase [Comamonas terrigena]